MAEEQRSAIVISLSSDIGAAIGQRWRARGYKLFGTYRTKSKVVDELRSAGIQLVQCNLVDPQSIRQACSALRALCGKWDILVICAGTQDPVSTFAGCDFLDWESSIRTNFIGQMHIVHELLPCRRADSVLGPCVMLFAGSGTNNAPLNYSAYVVSKIALIKMCELLDAEIPDTRFVILGPGWVKTKIHKSTLRAGTQAGSNYERTIQKLRSDECTPIERVLDCCDWLLQIPRESISGRNFSVVFDKWGTDELPEMLADNPEMYKLRRYGNTWLTRNSRTGG